MSSKKNIVSNGIASFFSKVVMVANQLVLVPFFIQGWGAAYYGEWLTLTIVPTVLAFSDLGFGSAAANTFVLRFASKDKKGAFDISKTGFWAITSMVFVGVVVTVLFLFFAHYFNFFSNSLIKEEDAIISLFLLMIARLIVFYQQLYEAYFRAVRRASLSINLQTLYFLMLLVLSIFVLKQKGTVVAFSITTFFLSVGFTIIYIFIAKGLIDKKGVKGEVKKSDVRFVLKKGLSFLMTPVWQALYFQGTTFVVRIVLGAESVTVFNTIRTLTRTVNQVFNMILNSVYPEMQYEIGKKNFPKVRRIFRVTMILTVLFAFVGVTFLMFKGMWFYEIWTKKVLNPPPLMFNILVLGLLFNAGWFASSYVYQAFNEPKKVAFLGLFSASLSVLCSYLLSKEFGLVGIAIGSLVIDVILFFFVLPGACRLLKQPLASLFRESVSDLKRLIGDFSIKSFFT